MAGPGDEMAAAAAGRGHLRASHADREALPRAATAAARIKHGRSQRTPPAETEPPPQVNQPQQHTAEAARSRVRRPRSLGAFAGSRPTGPVWLAAGASWPGSLDGRPRS